MIFQSIHSTEYIAEKTQKCLEANEGWHENMTEQEMEDKIKQWQDNLVLQ